jgi:Tol biopolymer transport system component
MRNKIMCVAVLLAAVLSVSALAAEWTTPVPVTSGINSQFPEWTPYLSYDGKSLYFARGHTDTSYEFSIYEAKRSQPSGAFTSVSQALFTYGHAYSPWVSPDNLRMYYGTDWQINVSQRASVNDPWEEGMAVDGLSDGITSPSLSANELTIVYNNPSVGGWDMYMATRSSKDEAFGNIRNLNELNTTGFDSRPVISPDALSIYWALQGQIYGATRSSLNDLFGNIQVLSALDMPGRGNDHPDIAISSDGKAIYFVSCLSGQPESADIYVSYLVPEPCTLLLLGIGVAIIRKKARS